MSATVIQILDAIAPQFASDPNKSLFIQLAEGRTSTTAFGSNYNLAVALRTAHMMTMAGRAGNAGSVSSISEGSRSISYTSADASKYGADLNQTSYGVELIGLIRGNISGLSVSGYVAI